MAMPASGAAPARSRAANQVYYFDVGSGVWTGVFTFRMTDWGTFWRDPIGVRHRMLTLGMALFQAVFGASRIDSEIVAALGEGSFGVARNVVRIHKFGLTLYLLRERYTLDANGTDVRVDADERFGPVPFLFRTQKQHPARIGDGGMSSVYEMPLLGTPWTARYTVHPDRNHIDGNLTCAWAESVETIHRV
jgi:hypothetical protein